MENLKDNQKAIESIPKNFNSHNKAVNEFKAYSDIIDFFRLEHNLVLLDSEIDEICYQVDKFKKKFNGEK